MKEKFSVSKWSSSKKCWYLPENNSIRHEIGMAPKREIGKIVYSIAKNEGVSEVTIVLRAPYSKPIKSLWS